MQLSPLTAVSPLDGRYQSKLNDLSQHASEYGLIYYRVVVEIRWFIFLNQHPSIEDSTPCQAPTLAYLQSLIDHFSLEDAAAIKKIEMTTNHDVKAVEYFLRERFLRHPELSEHVAFIHFACTSEDINNLAYSLMLTALRDLWQQQTTPLINELASFAKQYAGIAMLSRTHGQSASPTTLGKELANTVARLQRQAHTLKNLTLPGKLNGAVGNFNAHQAAYPQLDWPMLSSQFIQSLGLDYNAYTTQIEPHDVLAELLQAFSRFNTILIDFCRDTWGYISLGYWQQQHIETEVGSSTMPHKINPIDFENAEGNLGLANALAQHLANKLPISRWQRDLTDSTVMRNIGSVFGYAQLAYLSMAKGLAKISPNTALISNELNKHWEVLAEAIQTVMRRYHITDAYERLKTLTRGERDIDKAALHDFISQLPIPDEAKQQLLALTPGSYTGLAVSLATKISDNDD